MFIYIPPAVDCKALSDLIYMLLHCDVSGLMVYMVYRRFIYSQRVFDHGERYEFYFNLEKNLT